MTSTAIIPAFNEQGRIENVINTVRHADDVSEIIVVADGSTDNTPAIAESLGAKVVRHERNLGKGAAMLTGSAAAINESLLFLDADVSTFTAEDINKITDKLNEGYDFVKTHFQRDSGRVTQLTVRPLLKRFFPEVFERFPEPLSGQIGITKSALNSVVVARDYGVDIALLLDLYKKGAKIAAVEINWLKHRHHDLARLHNMALQVSREILARIDDATFNSGKSAVSDELSLVRE
ncbi:MULTISPECIES: glycosyltransferase [unclassified Mesorhizobium]|uniref:glycosyltransferase n=1 Tax=unclassified Mesorhizobium TaxID=325217 RepID=UPI0033368007